MKTKKKRVYRAILEVTERQGGGGHTHRTEEVVFCEGSNKMALAKARLMPAEKAEICKKRYELKEVQRLLGI